MKQIKQDSVPTDLAQCIEYVLQCLDSKDIVGIVNGKINSEQMHFGLGMYLRNSWSLWDTTTHLNQWFRANLRIGHADDISGVIIEAVVHRIRNEPFDHKEYVKTFHAHWAKLGCNEFGENYS